MKAEVNILLLSINKYQINTQYKDHITMNTAYSFYNDHNNECISNGIAITKWSDGKMKTMNLKRKAELNHKSKQGQMHRSKLQAEHPQ